jgi:hypothetical protein
VAGLTDIRGGIIASTAVASLNRLSTGTFRASAVVNAERYSVYPVLFIKRWVWSLFAWFDVLRRPRGAVSGGAGDGAILGVCGVAGMGSISGAAATAIRSSRRQATRHEITPYSVRTTLV